MITSILFYFTCSATMLTGLLTVNRYYEAAMIAAMVTLVAACAFLVATNP